MTATTKPKLSQRHTADLKRRAKAAEKSTDDDAKTGAADARAGRPREAPFGADEDAYGWGYDAELDAVNAAKKTRKTAATKKTPARQPAAKKSSSRSSSPRARRGPVRKAGAQARNRIEREATNQIASGLTVLAYAAVIAVLYNALTHAEYAAGTINGVARAVKWLDSPKPIPYGGQK